MRHDRGRARWTHIAALGLLGACSTAADRVPHDVQDVSDTLVRYRGPEVEVFVDTRYAEAHLGDEWLILPVSITATAADRVRIHRESFGLRGSEGVVYPLLSQAQFADAHSALYADLRSARIASPPVEHTGAARRPCGRWFFAAPGDGFGYPYLEVSRFRRCSGPLVFHVPGGVQAGSWLLVIDLSESRVRIPFTLEDSSPPRR